jgi:hypothetical protein
MANVTRNVKFGTKTDHKHIMYEYYIITPKKLQTWQQRNFETLSKNFCAVGN